MTTFPDLFAPEKEAMARITLEVRAYQGELPAAPIACCFDAAGGTIGRGPDNALVLPDAQKTVSRTHARVDGSGGAWWLTDLGSNPSRLNGRPVSGGSPVKLADGDRLEIGGYALAVVIDTGVAPATDTARGVGHALEDSPDRRQSQAVGLLHGLPPLEQDVLPGDPLALADVLAGAPVPDMQFDPLGMPARHDVRRDGRVAFAGSEHDHVSPEQFAFDPPPSHPARRDLHLVGIPDDYDPLSGGAAVAAREPRDSAPTRGPADPVTKRPSAPRPDSSSRDANTSAIDPTLAALLEGLGLEASSVRDRNSTEVARLAGRLLRTAVRGTVDVLLSRSVLKREVRLDTTLLLQRDNNPLKFFPDGDSALQQMLSGRGSGYLAAEPALQHAFDDIRRHELAVLAGMRAALQHVLGRFEPGQPDLQAQARGWLDRLPWRRKARQWDRFMTLYSELARAGDDDLQALCGNAFNEAYERQAGLARDIDPQSTPQSTPYPQRDDNVLE